MKNEKITTAKTIGQRCRRFRTIRGLTLAELADKVSTSSQNISKYEKEGISNIEMIQRLSHALGYDLLSDEMDADVNLSVVGKEILCKVLTGVKLNISRYISNVGVWGVTATKEILNPDSFYGLSKSQIQNELFKLQRMGLIVQEEFSDFDNSVQNYLFVTAKAILTLKYEVIPDDAKIIIEDSSKDIMTYERACCGYDCYQDWVESRSALKAVVNLSTVGNYRENIRGFWHNGG